MIKDTFLYIIPNENLLKYHNKTKSIFNTIKCHSDLLINYYEQCDPKTNKIKCYLVVDDVYFNDLINIINELDSKYNFTAKFIFQSYYVINKTIFDPYKLRTIVAYHDIKWKNNIFTIWQLTTLNIALDL